MGGSPAFSHPIHVGSPNVGDRGRFLARIEDMLDRRWLTNDGPFVRELEERIAQFAGVKHCVAMCNGTVALEIATRALNLSGEVICPAFTFIATAHALRWQEIKPVFCDINPDTHNLDPEEVETRITERTTGIIGVHLWGRPCEIEALESLAERKKLILMFDAAHAFGCSRRGRMIGGFGQAEVFSFHATKIFNTLEGGAVLTNNDEVAGKMKLMRNFGFAGYDCVTYLGMNGKMNEASAAMGLTLLESFGELVDTNNRNYAAYRDGLKDVPGIRLVEYDQSEKCNYQYVVAQVDGGHCPISRDILLDALHRENVVARRYFYPGCHNMEPYKSSGEYAGLSLPATDRVASEVLILPTGTAITPTDIAEVCGIIRTVVHHAGEVVARSVSLGNKGREA